MLAVTYTLLQPWISENGHDTVSASAWCPESGSRTRKVLSDPVDFESTASANSAIPAAGPRV